jgi:hypothetical protein
MPLNLFFLPHASLLRFHTAASLQRLVRSIHSGTASSWTLEQRFMFATAAAASRASENAILMTLFTLGQRKCLWLVLDQLITPSAPAPTHAFFASIMSHSSEHFTPTSSLSASLRPSVSTETQQSASLSPTAVHSVMCPAILASGCWSSTQSTLRRTSLQTLHSLHVLRAHGMNLKRRLSSGTNV